MTWESWQLLGLSLADWCIICSLASLFTICLSNAFCNRSTANMALQHPGSWLCSFEQLWTRQPLLILPAIPDLWAAASLPQPPRTCRCVFIPLGGCRHPALSQAWPSHPANAGLSCKCSFLTEAKPTCQSTERISAHLHKFRITELHSLSHGLSLKVCCISKKSLWGTELTRIEGRIFCKD